MKVEKKYADAPLGLFDVDDLLVIREPFDSKKYEQEHRMEWTAAIETNLRALIAAYGEFKLTDHVVDVYGATLGAAGERHVRAAIKTLHAAGAVANTGVGKYFFREAIRPVNSPQPPIAGTHPK